MTTSLVPWLLALLSIACLMSAAGLWWWRRQHPKKQALPIEWELNPRPVFNSDERRVYRHLRDALPQHIVLSKLPLVRFSQAADPKQVRYWYELLGGSSVAFAVCSTNGRVLLAIDLEGEGMTSRRSMQIKHAALAACKVRYLRCSADRLPSVPELRSLVPAMPMAVGGVMAPGGVAGGAGSGHANFDNAYASGPMPLDQAMPALHQASESLANAVASRRRERSALWQDSGFMQDSFFVAESDSRRGSITAQGGFDQLDAARSSSRMAPLPDDVGGIVIDTPVSPLRH
jgi:Protein of unknown function (DUF2726)